MKASILISFYLLKDIWKRWFETPGGVLSRLLVALLLSLLLLIIHASFTLSAASLQQKISQMGIRTILITHSMRDLEADRDLLPRLLSPLSQKGTLLQLRQLTTTATDEFGKPLAAYAYADGMLPALNSASPKASSASSYLLSTQLPAGMLTPVQIDTVGETIAQVIPPPTWLARLGSSQTAVLIPEALAEPFLKRGFLELIAFLGSETIDLTAIEAQLRTLLRLEDLTGVQINSPSALLSQLDEIETTQQKWQSGFGFFGGLAVSLVFGSIAILEYRQNRYIIALLRSFGTPSLLLMMRYFIEAALLVTLAALGARAAAIYLHPQIFSTIGIEPSLLNRSFLDPYSWDTTWQNLRWLALGALLSVLPIALALRIPVGKILP